MTDKNNDSVSSALSEKAQRLFAPNGGIGANNGKSPKLSQSASKDAVKQLKELADYEASGLSRGLKRVIR